jgi:hypothetical protein
MSTTRVAVEYAIKRCHLAAEEVKVAERAVASVRDAHANNHVGANAAQVEAIGQAVDRVRRALADLQGLEAQTHFLRIDVVGFPWEQDLRDEAKATQDRTAAIQDAQRDAVEWPAADDVWCERCNATVNRRDHKHIL